MQKLLDQNGYRLTKKAREGAGIDGDFGKLTARAVVRFQKDEGLQPDGVVGPLPWAALLD